jgi:hypothetical protein
MTRIQRPDPALPLQFPGQYRLRAAKTPKPADSYPGGLPAGDARLERQREGGGAPRYRTPGRPPSLGSRLFNWLMRTA